MCVWATEQKCYAAGKRMKGAGLVEWWSGLVVARGRTGLAIAARGRIRLARAAGNFIRQHGWLRGLARTTHRQFLKLKEQIGHDGGDGTHPGGGCLVVVLCLSFINIVV